MDSTGYQSEFIISMQLTPELQQTSANNQSARGSEPRSRQTGNVRRNRTAFTPYQEAELKAEFAESSSLYSCRRKDIAHKLGLCERVVKVWFQNQKQKVKRERQARTTQKIVATETGAITATRVPPTASDAPEVLAIPVFKPKTATRVTDLVPIGRDPSQQFKPQLIVRLSGGLPETSTKKTTTPVVIGDQPQPDDASLEKEISEFLVVRSKDRPYMDAQSPAIRFSNEECQMEDQYDHLQIHQPEHRQQNAYFHPQEAFAKYIEHPVCQHIPDPEEQQNKPTFTLQPEDQQQELFLQQQNWNLGLGQKQEGQLHWQVAQPHHQEHIIQQPYVCAPGHMAFEQQGTDQWQDTRNEQTPCPGYLLRQEWEAYTDQLFYGPQCHLPMAPAHQPLPEETPQYPHFSLEDGINLFADQHLAEPQPPSLDLDTSLSLQQEIEKYLGDLEENINISEFLDHIDMDPELGVDLLDRGAEKNLPDPAPAPTIDFDFHFDF